ncbi:MAG TPA: Ig-like domain-containing protein [Thermoanaerobaculia bacterium]|nr:Ig-like domain-containing protein [Thermoanaerobaculia bacterium]
MKRLFVCLLFVAAAARAQNYPLPGSAAAPPVICANCQGTNPWGQSNLGLPTWPYSSPIRSFTGRWVDSQTTVDDQGHGMRTVRAGNVLIASSSRGTAPPRAYLQLGAMLAAFDLSTFFNQKLPGGLVPVNSYRSMNGIAYMRVTGDVEKTLKADAYVYPEATGSGWSITNVDGQERLFDFDYDDRGYVYAAYMIFGWGIVRDSGEAGTVMLPKISQVTSANLNFGPTAILSLKANGHYYAVVGETFTGSDGALYDVDNAAAPSQLRSWFGDKTRGFLAWAKSVDGTRVAFVDGKFNVKIYDVATYIADGAPLATIAPPAGKLFTSITADNDGNFWAAMGSPAVTNNLLYKFSAANTWAPQTFDVYGGAFSATLIRFGEGYLAVAGNVAGNQYGTGVDTRIVRIDSGTPVLVETNGYFKNYYTFPPAGYARPSGYTSLVRGLSFYRQNGHLYLIYGSHGVGDVYEIESDALTASASRGGTVNPWSGETAGTIYYGDPVALTSETPIGQSPFAVQWQFDDPENAATTNALSGQTVTHQYAGALTTLKNSKAPSVKPVAGSLSGTAVAVAMTKPVVRFENNGNTFSGTFAAPTFTANSPLHDASDGSVEGHVSSWTIGNVTTKKAPSASIPAGDCGEHSLTLTGTYAPYDPSFNSTGTPYVAAVSTPYSVRPFLIAINKPADTSPNVTFSGTSTIGAAGTFTASTWTVTWALRATNGGSVITSATSNVAIGTIPSFIVPRASIANGNYIDLTVSLPTQALASAACQTYNSVTVSRLINYTAGSATKLSIDPLSDARTATQTSIVVKALDANGTVATDYMGTVHFTSDVAGDTAPANATFAAGDHGVKTICCYTFSSIGTRSIAATDVIDPSITTTRPVFAYGKMTIGVSANASTITAGSTLTFTVTVTSATPGSPSFNGTVTLTEDGTFISSQSVTGAGPLTASFSHQCYNPGTHTFTATYSADSNYGTTSASTPVAVNLEAPQSLVLTPTTSSVHVSWSSVTSAGAYELYRATAGTAYSLVYTGYGPFFTDTNVTPNSAYLYRVRAAGGPYGTPEVTTTMTFTDPSLSGVNVKAVHVTELRTAINAVRTLAGLSAASYTHASIAGTISGTNMSEMRTALAQARTALGLSTSFTDPTLNTSIKVKALHVQELRDKCN